MHVRRCYAYDPFSNIDHVSDDNGTDGTVEPELYPGLLKSGTLLTSSFYNTPDYQSSEVHAARII